MKRTLKNVPVGTTITVKKITGGRAVVRELEKNGIMAGSDVTMCALIPERGVCLVEIDRGEREIQLDTADHIVVEDQYVRTSEPILLGGCCACGDVTGLLDRLESKGDQ